MPIRYDAPSHEIEKLFNSLNGILFTGGETNIRDLNSTYMRTANQLLKATLAAHAKGDHVPLWYNHPLADMNFEFDFFLNVRCHVVSSPLLVCVCRRGTCMGMQTLSVLAAGSAEALTSRGIPRGNPGAIFDRCVVYSRVKYWTAPSVPVVHHQMGEKIKIK